MCRQGMPNSSKKLQVQEGAFKSTTLQNSGSFFLCTSNNAEVWTNTVSFLPSSTHLLNIFGTQPRSHSRKKPRPGLFVLPLNDADRRRENIAIPIKRRQRKNDSSVLRLDVTPIEAYNVCRVSKRINTHAGHQKCPEEGPVFCLKNSGCRCVLCFQRLEEGSNDPKRPFLTCDPAFCLAHAPFEEDVWNVNSKSQTQRVSQIIRGSSSPLTQQLCRSLSHPHLFECGRKQIASVFVERFCNVKLVILFGPKV